MHPDLRVQNCRRCNRVLCDPTAGRNKELIPLTSIRLPAPTRREDDSRVLCNWCDTVEESVGPDAPSVAEVERIAARHVSRKALLEDAGPWGDKALRDGEDMQ